jgi:hypothetical protein
LFRAGQLSFFDRGGVRLMLDKPEFDDPSSILYSGSAIFVRPTGALGMPELNLQTSRT